MKKISLTLRLVAITLLLSSCSFIGGRTMGFSDSDKVADNHLEQILDALKKRDKETLKGMFSEQALNEADDFDGRVDYLFDFFQGDVESWERDRFMADGLVEDGKKAVIPVTWYTVATDVDVYMFFLVDYIENTIDPDCVGLYTLRVIKAADEENEFGYYEDMKIPGIYKPKEAQ